jgi:hypothetical protein
MGEDCPARAVLRRWCVEGSGGTNKCCESSRAELTGRSGDAYDVFVLTLEKVRSEQGLVWADEFLLKMDTEGRGSTKDCAEVQDFAEHHNEIDQQDKYRSAMP